MLLSGSLVFVDAVLATLLIVLVVEVGAAIALRQPSNTCRNGGGRWRVAIIVPAHNESSGLLPTLADLRRQLSSNDRLLVVADNCTDDTAAVARAAAAEVVERTDPNKRGKGFALAYGVDHLRADPPDVIVVVDADCRLAEHAIDNLVFACETNGRPAQAKYQMGRPPDSRINHQVAEFAWRVKNWVRPLGLNALNLPCQLMGTGMAFPWQLISNVDLASGQLVEDLRLGLDLAAGGYAPLFCPSALVSSEFPSSERGTGTQRRRWEQGHIETIINLAPKLIFLAVISRNWQLLVLALDMAVPPLSLFASLIFATFGISVIAKLFGGSGASLLFGAVNLLTLTLISALAWIKCGRDILQINYMFLIPIYIARKLGLYVQLMIGRRASHWKRTERSPKTFYDNEHKALSVLLASGAASGTIAATRILGAHGFDVSIASSEILSAAAWSRWARHTHRTPQETDSRRFIGRLMSIGDASPGKILLSTSDQTAWLYAVNAHLLERNFRLYQPSLETIKCILDKVQLAEIAALAGLSVLPTWDPPSIIELENLAPSLPYPILIKPRTHVHRLERDKGVVVHSARELVRRYLSYMRANGGKDCDSRVSPQAGLPILQKLVPVGPDGVVSVTGFRDRKGRYFVTRRATKVFQRSRPVGVGVCFESLPPDNDISRSVERLCQRMGYFGIFEVEFIFFNGSWALIDFNPRLFNQVGLDIRRGMSLPVLACLDAAGEEAALKSAVGEAMKEGSGSQTIFYDRFTLAAMLFVMRITGLISKQELRYWRRWRSIKAGAVVDAAADPNDPVPGIVHALSEIFLGAKALPRFVYSANRFIRDAVARSSA